MLKNNIIINYISNYKFNIKNIFFYNLNLLKIKKNILFFFLPLKKKYFTLLKSPKCHKIAKLNINYSFFNFFFNLYFLKKLINLKNLLIYFFYIKNKYKIYQTPLIKIKKFKLIIYISYNLII